MLFFHEKDPVLEDMEKTLHLLKIGDPALTAALNASTGTTLDGLSAEARRTTAIAALEKAIDFAKQEPDPEGHTYHSRDPLTGITQSCLAAKIAHATPDSEDNVLPELQAFGQGNPFVWIPTGIDGILEHFKPKAPFKVASPEKSDVELPESCTVALLADWGADNDHAKRLGELAKSKGADFVIHLGDIYYSGAKSECETFLRNWPLTGADGLPKKGRSFALNGNHEMYSLGRYYFTTVLDGLGQEASYFTLSNQWWQVHGLDTAYVPFTISGGNIDASLRPQWDWLLERIKASPHKKNIFLSHNQPLSAHLPEFEASYPLRVETFRLQSETNLNAIFAWFFGHEHRCTIYDDNKTDFKARLIGNGSIPHAPQTETAAQKDETNSSCTPFAAVNAASLDGGPVAISTLALLHFDRNTCAVDYINEDGSTFYKREEWTNN